MKNIREKALFIIDDIFNKGAFLEEEINILKLSKISTRDYTFVRELTTGVVRNKTYLDYVIKVNSNFKLKKIHRIILIILEMGIYQLYFMDKVPKYSIVDESVKLAKVYGNKGSISFVNAILRNIGGKEKQIVKIKDSIENLSVYYSHPKYYTKYFYENYGVDFTKKLLQANNKIADFIIRVNTLKTSKKELISLLNNANYIVREGKFEDSLVIDNPKDIFETDLFNMGYFYAQDYSSIKVSQILDPKKNSRVLDLCAAPGGKTTHLAAIMENTGQIIACDKNEYKLDLIRENAKRLSVTNLKLMINDALLYNDEFKESFDYVLIDAPCSGLGLYRRKPDIKWKRSTQDIEALAEIQRKIINNGAKYVKNGGTLVYSTCSIWPRENDDVICNFLSENKNFSLVEINGERIYKLYPFENCDGFSIAKLKKSVD